MAINTFIQIKTGLHSTVHLSEVTAMKRNQSSLKKKPILMLNIKANNCSIHLVNYLKHQSHLRLSYKYRLSTSVLSKTTITLGASFHLKCVIFTLFKNLLSLDSFPKTTLFLFRQSPEHFKHSLSLSRSRKARPGPDKYWAPTKTTAVCGHLQINFYWYKKLPT